MNNFTLKTNVNKLGQLLYIGGIDEQENKSGYNFIEKYDLRNEVWTPLNVNISASSNEKSCSLNAKNMYESVMKRLEYGLCLKVKDSTVIFICGGRDGFKTLSSGYLISIFIIYIIFKNSFFYLNFSIH